MNLEEAPKTVINSVCQFPDEYKSKMIKMALVSYQPTAQDRFRIIENFSNDTGIPKDQIYEVLSVYIGLIRFFLGNSDSDFNGRLLEIGFTPAFIEKLPFIGNREEIVKNLLNNSSTDFAKLSHLKWKIDISLTNSALVKKVPTNLILCLTFKNGSKYTIEVEAKTFHKLRFNVTLILKELNLLKSSF